MKEHYNLYIQIFEIYSTVEKLTFSGFDSEVERDLHCQAFVSVLKSRIVRGPRQDRSINPPSTPRSAIIISYLILRTAYSCLKAQLDLWRHCSLSYLYQKLHMPKVLVCRSSVACTPLLYRAATENTR